MLGAEGACEEGLLGVGIFRCCDGSGVMGAHPLNTSASAIATPTDLSVLFGRSRIALIAIVFVIFVP